MGPPIDRGWAWVVLVSSLLLQALGMGIGMGAGVFIVEWKEAFDCRITQVAWIGSLCAGIIFISAPVASVLCNRFSHRTVIILGSVFSSLGLISTAFSTNVNTLYISFGLVTGFGVSCVYNPGVVMVGFYFRKHRALAMGLSSIGSGVGTMAMAPLSRVLISYYGWRGALLICAGIMLNGAVLGTLMRPVGTETKCVNIPCKTEKSPGANMMNLGLLKDFRIWATILNHCLWCVGTFVFFILIVDYVTTSGLSKDAGALMVCIAGLMNCVAKIGVSLIMSVTKRVTPLHIYTLSCTMLGMSLLLFPSWGEYEGFILFSVIFGIFYGGVMGSLAISVVDMFGVENSTSAFCYTVVGDGIGALIGPPIAGTIFDTTGENYCLSFVFGGTCGIISGCVMAGVMVLSHHAQNNKTVKGSVYEVKVQKTRAKI